MIRRSLTLWFCLLAVWVRLLAPAVAMEDAPTIDPFSVVCSSHPVESGEARSDPRDQDRQLHKQCPFCQLHIGALLLDDRPGYTTFDYPVVSRLRWVVRDVDTARPIRRADARPRGPPTLI